MRRSRVSGLLAASIAITIRCWLLKESASKSRLAAA
jgi:hypothetical protein